MIQAPGNSGMVTYSATNPRDEIPVGPQVFPFGNPQLSKSTVEPYLATNYKTGVSTQLPTTGIQMGSVQAATELPQYQTYTNPSTSYQMAETPLSLSVDAYPTTSYQKPAYQAVTQPQYRTVYKTVTRYKPVTKTVMVPQVTTSYIAAPSTSVVGQSYTPPPVN